MPKPSSGQQRYMPGLDGLRAVAVLGVIAFHIGVPWAQGGLLGVGVFFVLSGYLITDILVRQFEDHGRLNLKDFWLRRARRLLPALWLLLIAVAAYVTIFMPGELASLRDDVLAAFFYVSNWWYVFHHVSYFQSFGPPSPLTHLWSLAVEEQFYLLWPGLLWLMLRWLPRRGVLAATLGLAALSAVEMALLYAGGAGPNRMYYGSDTRAFALLIGGALALVWPSRRLADIPRLWRGRLELLGAAALGGILVLFVVTNENQRFLYPDGLLLLSLATAAAVAAAALPDGRLGRVLGAKPLRWLGVRSYGIYLWHYPVIALTTPLTQPGFVAWRALLQVAAAIFLAALSWRYVEEPIRRGALARLGQFWRERTLGLRALGSTGAVTAACTAVLGLVACLGLLGLVPAAAADPEPKITAVLPPPALPAVSPAPNVMWPHVILPRTPAKAQTTPVAPSGGEGITAIGDSVMIDAAPYLQQMLPGITIDAVVGRQFYQAPAVIGYLRSQGELGSRVIIELGTNGPFDQDQLVALLKSLSGVQEVILVNTRVPRPWQGAVNQTLAAVAGAYPHTVLVNWYEASKDQPGFFYPDGVHLDPDGARFYANLLVQALDGGSAAAATQSSTRRAQHAKTN